MESDKSVYAVVAIFALVIFIILGIVAVLIVMPVVKHQQTEVEKAQSSSNLFLSLRQSLADSFIGDIARAFVGRGGNKEDKAPELRNVELFNEVARQERINYILTNGQETSKTGSLEVLHYDDFDNKKSWNEYYLREDEGKRSRIYFTQDLGLISGARLRVEGKSITIRDNDEIAIESYVVESEGGVSAVAGAEVNPNLGEQRTAVILINTIGDTDETTTREEAYRRIFDENEDIDGDGLADSINSWVREVSYGKTWLSGDVFGYYTLSLTKQEFCTKSPGEIRDIAMAKAYNQDKVDFRNYIRLIIFINNPGCYYGGLGSIGITTFTNPLGTFSLSTSIVTKLDEGLVAHELGHNFGLYHANALECGSNVIGDCDNQPYGGILEYGGVYDVMSFFTYLDGHYNAYHKEKIGWLDPENIENILTTNQTGKYILKPLETNEEGIKALKIEIDDDLNYYVEYRRPIGYDKVKINNHYRYNQTELYDSYEGALINSNEFSYSGDTLLFDNSPNVCCGYGGQFYDFLNSVLKKGETFFDPQNYILITVTNLSNESLEVYVGSPTCGDEVVDLGEQCDRGNLNGQTCNLLGRGSGELSCTNTCRYDYSRCLGKCNFEANHTLNPDNSCTAVFTVDQRDGEVYVGSPGDWNELRNRNSGIYTLSHRDYINLEFISDNRYGGNYLIKRVSYPFNTISIPDSAFIKSATISLYKLSTTIQNSHPNSDDFLSLVPTTFNNPPSLGLDDFDEFSSVDYPIEISNRVDISQLSSLSSSIYFTIKDDSLNKINKTGFSVFGLRFGYDFFPQIPNFPSYNITKISIRLYTGNSVEGKPQLFINYIVPFCGNSILETGEECDDGNTINGDGCSSTCKIEEIIFKERNGCWDLNWNAKSKINELKQNPENVIVLKEGDIAYKNNYVVVLTQSGGTIVKASIINNDSASYSSDNVQFTDVLTGETYQASIIEEGKGQVIIAGKTIYAVYTGIGSNDNNYIKLTWGNGASYGNLGDKKDTFYCEKKCEDNDISTTYPDGKNLLEKGEVVWKDENGAGGTMYDECESSNVNKVYETYCVNGKVRRELIDCPTNWGCFDGACKSEGICGNNIVEENEVCDPPGKSDCVINGYPGKQECLGPCILLVSCGTGYYCGDLICNGPENKTNCAIDCDVICGNGVKQAGEGCDDGNLNSGDGCSPTCQLEKECIDTDNGQDIFVFGNVTEKSIPDGNIIKFYNDGCSPSIPGGVLEYYCDPFNLRRISLPCPDGYSCSNGACEQISPSPVLRFWERVKRMFGF